MVEAIQEAIQIELTISLEGHTIQHMGETSKKSKDFFYEVESSYHVFAANSILTTITGEQQIKVDFCVESLAIPTRVTHEIKGDNEFGELLDVEPADKSVRRVQTGVLLTLHDAEKMAKFLLLEVERFKARQTAQK